MFPCSDITFQSWSSGINGPWSSPPPPPSHFRLFMATFLATCSVQSEETRTGGLIKVGGNAGNFSETILKFVLERKWRSKASSWADMLATGVHPRCRALLEVTSKSLSVLARCPVYADYYYIPNTR